MKESLLIQLDYLARILIAGICGALIGFERKNRLKEAGIRTHFIVALASALIMIISKYGFDDIIGVSGIALDPSRIAAQVVSGVGFLGAGLIFIRKQSISGLTTAAGIWATAAVGIAIGSGLYMLGIIASIVIVIAQILLHRSKSWIKLPTAEQITLKVCDDKNAISYIQQKFEEANIDVITIKIDKVENNCLEIDIYTKLPKGFKVADLLKLFNDNQLIKSLEI